MNIYKRLVVMGITMFCLQACETREKAQPTQQQDTPVKQQPKPSSTEYETEALWSFCEQALEGFVHSTQQLSERVTVFLSSPTEKNLSAARQAWKNSHSHYHRLFLINQFSIIEPTLFGAMARAQFSLAAYPIQPGYLDYFDVYLYSGLVHDVSIGLNEELLRQQHGMTDVEDVVLGLYAIEFMLFGEHSTRPQSDFQVVTELSIAHRERGYKTIEETANNRRRMLLALQLELLDKDAQQALLDWRSIRQPWQQLSYNVQRATVHKAFEQGLTQVLLQTANASDNGSPIHSPEHLATAIRSLEAVQHWLPEYLREEQLKLLQEAAESIALALDSEADKDAIWRQTYNDLKMAMDLTGSIAAEGTH